MNHPIKEIQFFFDLKTLIREKNSLNNSLCVGFISSLFSFFQPYEGVCNTLSIKAMRFFFWWKDLVIIVDWHADYPTAIISFSSQLKTVSSLQDANGSLLMISISISLPCSIDGFPNLSNKRLIIKTTWLPLKRSNVRLLGEPSNNGGSCSGIQLYNPVRCSFENDMNKK